ncbi:hypothetical protein JKF63_01223 [Porcisia hertigi]|uniref:ATP-grasp domain-containing protein n=1 Tax=Porcisia hertigi TaxID=2761500 RepID=A0A836HH96_9TRYP|nr:hypothetical protein JKF63_01223 [Porcisia hertigi]
MHGKVIVFLRTSSVARVPLYSHLRSLGSTLVLVHPTTVLSEFDGLFHHWLPCETDDVEGVHLALSTFLARLQLVPDAVVSFDEYAVYQAAAIAVRLNLTPVPLPPNALRENNLKNLFRLFCNEHGISSPKSVPLPVEEVLPTRYEMRRLAQDEDALSMAFEKVQPALAACISETLKATAIMYPVVLKSSPGAGSILARLCITLDDAVAHVWQIWKSLEDHLGLRYFTALANRPPDGAVHEESLPLVRILTEEFIEGQEVDMDCIIEHGVVRFCAISDNCSPTLPYLTEAGGLCPSLLGYDAQCALRDLLDTFVRAHGARLHGVIHFEAKYDPIRQRAYVIEVNCRPGSAETHMMLQTVYRGLNLGEAVVRCALHMPIQDQLSRLFPELLGKQNGGSTVQQASRGASSSSSLSGLNANAHIMTSATESSIWSLLGGPSRGFFPSQCWAASVNIYPAQCGVLRKACVPLEDASLVAYSIASRLGEVVAPPPKRFFLLCWMVARGATAAEAKENIYRVTSGFEQEVIWTQ